jgi:hypothetical protein
MNLYSKMPLGWTPGSPNNGTSEMDDLVNALGKMTYMRCIDSWETASGAWCASNGKWKCYVFPVKNGTFEIIERVAGDERHRWFCKNANAVVACVELVLSDFL